MRRNAILAVLFPLVVMSGWLGKLYYDRTTGLEIELPITGYDPRDLLSGHYMRFQVVYGEKGGCPSAKAGNYRHLGEPYCQCVQADAKPTVYWSGPCEEKPETCGYFIKGKCGYSTFEAGIDRFYISEEKSHANLRINAGAKIKLSVPSSGRALVTDLIP